MPVPSCSPGGPFTVPCLVLPFLALAPLFAAPPAPLSPCTWPPWQPGSKHLLAFPPALASGIGVKQRPLGLRPAVWLPASYREERRPRSHPTWNQWAARQPPTPDGSCCALNEHLWGLSCPRGLTLESVCSWMCDLKGPGSLLPCPPPWLFSDPGLSLMGAQPTFFPVSSVQSLSGD